MRRYFSSLLLFVSVLSGCSPQLVNFPFDPSGHSLNSNFADLQPRLSGRYLVFVSDRSGTQDLYLYDTVMHHLLELPGLNAIDMRVSSPGISANGRFVVFAGTREGQSGVYIYDRETRQLRNLTENLKAEVRSPTITADGDTIAFESSANGQWDILLYNRSGEPLPTLMDAP